MVTASTASFGASSSRGGSAASIPPRMAPIAAPAQGRASGHRGPRRSRAIIGLIGIAALAGCKVVPRQPPVIIEPPVVQQPAPVTPGLPVDTDRHRIALLVPQGGVNADVGQSIANATTMALLDIGITTLRVTSYDTSKGADAAARAAVADGNKLILGPLLSQDVVNAAPIARAAGVPMLSFSNDTAVAGNGVFLLGYVPGQSVERVVDYAGRKGVKRFAAMLPQTTYGERALAAFRAGVTRAGGMLVTTELYMPTSESLAGAARRLSLKDGYDAVLIADSGANAIRAVPVIKGGGNGVGAAARILGTELWNTEAALAGSAPMRGAWFASVSDGLYGQLATKYRARYGKAPFRLASLGYDAVLLAQKVSRNWKPGTNFPMNRLLTQDGFGGIDGIFRFDNRGIAVRALEVSEVGAGGFRVVEPAPTQW